MKTMHTKYGVNGFETRWEGTCQRCGRETDTFILSYFNRQLLCEGMPESCSDKEMSHPNFARVRDDEKECLSLGLHNFVPALLPRWVKSGSI
jgi:hypothetical protein